VQDDLEMSKNTYTVPICNEHASSIVSEGCSVESDRTDTTTEYMSTRKRTRQLSMAASLRTKTTPTKTRTTRESANETNALLECYYYADKNKNYARKCQRGQCIARVGTHSAHADGGK
jgi:hypothetical protein